MSKVLVIAGADYSAAALDHITIADDVPCTGISVNPTALTFESIGESKELIATVTPFNTTDDIVWESSNDNVASVSNGVVIVHGIGVASITVSCGRRSATVRIEQTSLKVTNIVSADGKYPDKIYNDNDEYFIGCVNHQSLTTIGQEYNADDVDIHVRNSGALIQAIRVPFGASNVSAHSSSKETITGRVIQGNPNEPVSYNGYTWPKYISVSSDKNILQSTETTPGYCVIFRTAIENSGSVDYVEFT